MLECFGVSYDEKDGMYSEHLVVLSSISCLNQSIKNILEIGTYDGRTALILSKLFVDANILSIDLPAAGKDFESMYSRKGKVQDFVENRNKNLGANKQIRFLETNSIALTNIEEKFDLIWVDGGHFFPEVSWDICNAFHYCNTDGHIIVDDVSEARDGKISDKVSSDPRNMLEYLKCRLGIDVDFFLKRTDRRSLSDQAKLKYLGVIRKRELI